MAEVYGNCRESVKISDSRDLGDPDRGAWSRRVYGNASVLAEEPQVETWGYLRLSLKGRPKQIFTESVHPLRRLSPVGAPTIPQALHPMCFLKFDLRPPLCYFAGRHGWD